MCRLRLLHVRCVSKIKAVLRPVGTRILGEFAWQHCGNSQHLPARPLLKAYFGGEKKSKSLRAAPVCSFLFLLFGLCRCLVFRSSFRNVLLLCLVVVLSTLEQAPFYRPFLSSLCIDLFKTPASPRPILASKGGTGLGALPELYGWGRGRHGLRHFKRGGARGTEPSDAKDSLMGSELFELGFR